MAGTLPPGIGNTQQALQATAFIRSEPWYLQWIASKGKQPDANGNVKLSDNERDQLRDLAVSHGIGLNNKFDGIDENGQIVEEHHKLRNGLIAAGIGAAALSGLGAAGIGPLSGLLGGSAATGAGAAGLSTGVGAGASAALPSTIIGSGFIPAVVGGTGLSTAAGAGGAASILGTGAKLASLASGLGKLGSALDPNNVGGPGSTSPRGSAYAAQANQLANNRAAAAKIDQSGPSADAQAFKNQMRAALVARMDPNAAPISLNGTALPQLATPEGVTTASKLRDTLAARIAAGKTPTTFGIADPTQEELDAQAKAADAAGVGNGLNSDLANIGDYLQTGSRLAGLGKNAWDIGSTVARMF